MKFLCPSCKAKYQIADEKVAGRSVRMKCRKCGYVIPISEIPPAPETLPPGEDDWDAPPAVVPKAPAVPNVGTAPAAPVTRPAAPDLIPRSAPLGAKPPPSSTATASRGAVAPNPAAPSRVATAPKAPGSPSAESARKPALTDLKGLPKPPSAPGASPAALTPSKSAVKPAVPAVGAPRAPQPAPSTTTRAPVPKPAAPAVAAKSSPEAAPTPAVAAKSSPQAAPAPAVAAKSSPQAAASPAVAPAVAARAPGPPAGTPPFPELEDASEDDDDATRIVKGGALADAFGALVGGAAGGTPQELGMPADEWFVGINDVPVGPIRLNEIRKRAVLGAVTLESMVWRDGFEAWRPLKTFPELVAVLEESMSSVRASAAPLSASNAPPLGRRDDAFSSPGASSGTTGAGVVTDDSAAGLPRARPPVFAWLAVIVALGFGLTIGFVLWSKQKPPETIVKYVEVPAKTTATAITVAQDPQAAGATSPTPTSTSTKPHTKSTSSAKTADAPADKGGGLTGLRGLSGLSPSGPGATGANPGSTPSGGGGQLDAAQTQATVARYTGSVKRSCWQPALDARDPNAPTSARVMVTITVGGTGSVQNVTTSGDPHGYPGLANCIGARVHAWTFPATGGTTTVNVPFVFAAQ